MFRAIWSSEYRRFVLGMSPSLLEIWRATAIFVFNLGNSARASSASTCQGRCGCFWARFFAARLEPLSRPEVKEIASHINDEASDIEALHLWSLLALNQPNMAAVHPHVKDRMVTAALASADDADPEADERIKAL